MKFSTLLCSTAFTVATALAAGETKPVPEAHPIDRYAEMVDKSPFALATPAAPVAEPQASFAANWYVAGIARIGDTDFVTIKSRDASTQFSLFGREPQNGVSVASVEWSETIGKSKVILQKGTETAKLEFNEADLRGPAQVANAAAGGARPPGSAGVPGVVVTPPGANNAPRPMQSGSVNYPAQGNSGGQGMPSPSVAAPAGSLPQSANLPPGTSTVPSAPGFPGGNAMPSQPGASIVPGQTPPGGGEVRRRIRVIGAPQQ